jgi:hypothetical protein
MFVKMRKTVHNISGVEFKEGQKVEVVDCWFNKIADDIYISVKLDDKYLIGSIKEIDIVEDEE